MMRIHALLLALALTACGGAAAPPRADDVTTTWTAGDDAPLDSP